MWSLTLRGFAAANERDIQDLTPVREYRFRASDLASAKQQLSELILDHVLPPETFYRFEGRQSDSRLTIAFYLFEDRRICPVRIWNRAELFGRRSAGSQWMVDFNGLPPWSAITAVEPRWQLVGDAAARKSTVGRSARDWRKRMCWAIDGPAETTLVPRDLAS